MDNSVNIIHQETSSVIRQNEKFYNFIDTRHKVRKNRWRHSISVALKKNFETVLSLKTIWNDYQYSLQWNILNLNQGCLFLLNVLALPFPFN